MNEKPAIGTIELSLVDELVEHIGRDAGSVVAILQAIQDQYHYLPAGALQRVCEITDITPAAIAGVSTFYDQFRHEPAGEFTIRVCVGTACHVAGAPLLHAAFKAHLGIPDDHDTDADKLFTVSKVACLGCCTLAPAVQIGDIIYGPVAPSGVGQVLKDFLDVQARQDKEPGGPFAPPAGPAGEIRVSMDTCCIARGSHLVYQALNRAVAETRAAAVVKGVGCVGMSYMEPLVEVLEAGAEPVMYAQVGAEDARAIVGRHFKPAGVLRRAAVTASATLDKLLTDEAWTPVTRYARDIRDESVSAFVGPQKRIATEACGQNRPLDLEEYIRHGGFEALRTCLTERSPEQIIEHIEAAGLRGRGGAGYPTGLKWQYVRAAAGEKKYVVCNGDEGDPGAFMDRMLLESQPFRIIEGMAIAAAAVGADEGYFYIRAEYPLAVERMTEAIGIAEQHGYLGENILGAGARLKLHLMHGAGAFVCGEETALLASIEGRRGMPRLRPPYPAQAGLFGRPTLVNNTETLSMVPWIIRNGSAAFAAMGTETSRGTKVFALAGKIHRGGLIEVPMGVTLRQIVDEIGGGVPDGKAFKAAQIGGPSGGCIPAALADTPIDYEALTELGAMMGSGGLVVLDESDCMVDIARYFLEFTQDQSCGKCTTCRIGTKRMLEILTRLCEGEGRAGDLARLEELAATVKASSLCGLGKTAPNPVLSTLEYFRDEYEAHLAGRCPAGVCKALVTYSITDDCIGCTRCAQHCPADAIEMRPHEQHEIDTDKCVRCGTCKLVCPANAVEVK